MKKLIKKGQITSNLNLLVLGAVLFVVTIVVITVGAQITTTLRDNIDRGRVAVDNESDAVNLLWGNNTNMTLDFDEVSVTALYNCTGSAIISTGNYTVFSSLGIIQGDSNSSDTQPHDGNPVCVNYTYLNDPMAYNVSDTGGKGILTFSDYFSVLTTIIVLVVIVTLLIGVIALFQRKS